MSKHQPKIAIIIIHYNTPEYLEGCLSQIYKQSYKNIDIYLIDNNSTNRKGFKKIKENRRPNLKIIENQENLGYAKAANQGIHLAKDADYVVITNPDILYSPSYFEKIVHRAERENALSTSHVANTPQASSTPHIANTSRSSASTHRPLAGITGKVYKYDFKNKRPTRIIDTVGLYISKSLRITDGAQGVEDKGQFDKEKEVFGISGACPMYSRKALEAARINSTKDDIDEYFDEDFFMYKEDVDLSWRLQILGYKFLYYPKAVAFHGRGTGVVQRKTLRQIVKNRKTLNKFQKYYSYRNHNLTLFKNLTWGNYLKNFAHIVSTKLLKTAYVLIYEPHVLKSLIDYVKLRPKMRKKRRIIMRKKKKNATKIINKFMKARP